MNDTFAMTIWTITILILLLGVGFMAFKVFHFEKMLGSLLQSVGGLISGVFKP